METTGSEQAMTPKKGLQRAWMALWTILVLTVAWNVWHYYFNAANVSQKEPWNIAQWWLYDKGLDRAIRADNVGGDTPEGAMQGYIAALEAGDIDLAAKYYIPIMQKKISNELSLSKKNGNIYKYAEYLKGLNLKRYSTSTNSYVIYKRDENGMARDEYGFALNPYSNKWKIAEP